MYKENCVFCEIAKGRAKAKIIGESASFIAIEDIRPAVEGHTLIIPKNHFDTLLDIPDELSIEMI